MNAVCHGMQPEMISGFLKKRNINLQPYAHVLTRA